MKYLLSALFAAGLVGAADADPMKYHCEFKSHSNTGWIPRDAVFEIYEKAGKATVYDDYVHYVHNAAIETDYQKKSATKHRMRWTLNGLPTTNAHKAIATYTARLDTVRNRVTIGVRLHSADNEPRGTGKCKKVK